jgi:nuclear pore complex protein Nup155
MFTQPENLAMLDLMWKYYEKQRNFAAAARILAMLAEKLSSEITLQQRLEYLSRAAMCSMSVTSHISTQGDGDFLDQLEDKLAVSCDEDELYHSFVFYPKSE